MRTYDASDLDEQFQALKHLKEHGYVVLTGMLAGTQLDQITSGVEKILESERETPFDPGDGPESAEDEAIRSYLSRSYQSSDAEIDRVMKRIRFTRVENQDTPWPVEPHQVNHNFMHIPLILDGGRSQRSYNLPAKLEGCDRLMEHPALVKILDDILEPDFILSEMAATSVGPQTDGGYWHVDAPLSVCPEPLPDTPLAVQSIWMIDEFTAENGASRVVPGSHRSRKKPPWNFDSIDGEIPLQGPIGSAAFWLSHTWHRAGPNSTDRPRRAVLGYYSRAWVKPFSDYTRSVPQDVVKRFSPRVRYLLGWSAFGPNRG
jgi:hypothetical protein